MKFPSPKNYVIEYNCSLGKQNTIFTELNIHYQIILKFELFFDETQGLTSEPQSWLNNMRNFNEQPFEVCQVPYRKQRLWPYLVLRSASLNSVLQIGTRHLQRENLANAIGAQFTRHSATQVRTRRSWSINRLVFTLNLFYSILNIKAF